MDARLFNPAVGEWMPARQWFDQLVARMQPQPLCAADMRKILSLHKLIAMEQDSDTMRETWGDIVNRSPAMAHWVPGPREYAFNSREHCARLLS
jgi:carboxylate-amine ligase